MLGLIGTALIPLPDIDHLIGTTTAWTSATGAGDSGQMGLAHMASNAFLTMMPYMLAIAGFIIGALLVRLFVIKGVMKGTKRLTGRR